MSESKVLVFDIEVATHPDLMDACKKYGLNEWKLSWKIDASTRYVTHISFGWLGESKVTDLSLLNYGSNLRGAAYEKQLLKDFAEVYNSANQTVAHYGSKFDLNFLNSRMAQYGLPRLKPVKMSDTWRILKEHFALPHNTLDAAIRFFECPYGKPKLSQEVWQHVAAGDEAAHKLLRHRCRFDVKSLRWIYQHKLQVYDTHKINRALAYSRLDIDDQELKQQLTKQRCKTCLSVGSLKREGYQYSKTKTSLQLSCKQCQDWSSAPLEQFKTDNGHRYRMGAVR